MKDSGRKDSIKLIIVAIMVTIGIIGVVSYTYSFFEIEATNTTAIKGEVASMDIELTVNKVAPTTDTELGLIPQLDSAITSAVVGRNNKSCIDDNGNEVCQVYEIKVKNTSTAAIKVDGVVELNKGSNTNLKWARISNAAPTKPTLLSGVNEASYTTLTANETYNANQEKTYYIVVWISETGGVQLDSGDFSGVVHFGDSVPASDSSNTLYALNIVPKSDTPDFTKTSCSSGCGESTVGVYSYEDDLGTSYYFRGDVENNYVYFANKYWRIIRINGDGTVRMIYDGTTAHANGESSNDRIITISVFNSKSGDNAFVGYMNGTTDGTNFPNGTTTSASYTEAHTNNYDSTIKTYLEDTWYPTISASDKSYIADAIYCNDRSLDTSSASYTGIGNVQTYYGAYQRLVRNRTTSVDPSLKCTNPNDRFTLESTNFEIETNGKLEAPVGLITADEISLAGGFYQINNQKYYLYTGHYYWVMSPTLFSGSYALAFRVDTSGFLRNDYRVDGVSGVRAVLTLESDALKYSANSDGTINRPFTVTG